VASGDDLLDKMRRSPHGHKQGGFKRMLEHYGFEKSEGGSHTTYTHELLGAGHVVRVPRHRKVRDYVAKQAVAAIDSVISKRQEEEDGEKEEGS
jgi:predicted RNA binding protein YcfA (HicA-like mRNA interferase family)